MKKYLLIIAIMAITAAVFTACSKGASSSSAEDTAGYISGDITGTLTDFEMFAFFNNEMIPFTPHYSSYDGFFGDFKLDRLELFYNEKTHELRPVQEDLLIYDYEEFMDKIFFTDYNFDGFVDVAFRSYFGPFGRSEIFLYNPHTNVFYRHEELSSMTNARIDEEKQIISSFDDGGDQGMIFDICEYKWIHENLTLIYSDRQDYDVDLGLYVRITRTLQGNGTWTEERETHAALFDE